MMNSNSTHSVRPAPARNGGLVRTGLALALPACFLGLAGLAPNAARAVDAVAEAVADAAAVATVEFNEDLLRIPVDVRMFAEGNPVPAGTYRIDLHMNDQWKGRTDVRFQPLNPGDRVALPCFDAALLDMLGFDLQHLNPAVASALEGGGQLCTPISGMFDGANASYDSGALRLDVGAPQIVMRREARGYVDPSLWDDGITAATVQYNYNAYHSSQSGNGFSNSNTNQYLGLRASFNFGPWRLRYNGSASHSNARGLSYRSNGAYVERGLPRLKSHIAIGQLSTEGQVFDSLSFEGVRLSSDERMRPDSQRGFAPIVRGIAQSNARVVITQNGSPIYETTVPPGPFIIDDLYPTGTSGDLVVTVTEADGRANQFTVSFTSQVDLVRPGTSQYTLAAGRYRSYGRLNDEPMFVQGTLRRGIANTLTGYTGLMVGEGYAAVAGGLVFNLPVGAVSADMTVARTSVPKDAVLAGASKDTHHQGYSARVTYAKRLPVIDTNISVASYRYSSSGYLDPGEAFQIRNGYALGGGVWNNLQRRRNRMMLSASQSLPGSLGYLGLSASLQDYWQRDGRDMTYNVNYGTSINRMSLGLAASRSRNLGTGEWDNQYMLSMSMPLGGGARPMHMSTSLSHSDTNQSVQASVSGSMGRDNAFNYNLYGSANNPEQGSRSYNGGASASLALSKVSLSASASASSGSRQFGVSMSGGVVAFGGGVVFTPTLGDTIAVVEAKDAAGATIGGGRGLKLDRRGHAVVSYMSPYRQNTVNIDPAGLSTDVALATTSQRTVPTAGAVVLLRYETDRNYSILVNGRRSDGSPLPFAAGIFDANERNVGYVAQAGQALVNVDNPQGTLSVRWGSGINDSCVFTYSVNERIAPGEDFRRADAVCVTGARFATDPKDGNYVGSTTVSSR